MYFLALGAVVLLFAGSFLMWRFVTRLRRRALWESVQKSPLPPAFAEALGKVPHYRVLPVSLKEKLRPRILYFCRTREFRGVGLSVTDEMRAVISFYACLMVVNLPGECYEELVTILVYPYDVVSRRVEEEGGVFREEEWVLRGESTGDTVVIAWHEARKEAYHPRQHNVILHELAHVLDFEDGVPDGVPAVERSMMARWTRVLYRRYRELRERIRRRQWDDYRLLGEYAATDEAEFFAVVTELFFTRPAELKRRFPDLYEEFVAFYRLDTAKLFESLD